MMNKLAKGILTALVFCGAVSVAQAQAAEKILAYIVSDQRIPFWEIMSRGLENGARARGYELKLFSSDNDPKRELENVAKAIKHGVDGIVISPTTSSAASTILMLAGRAGIPVVISDIGTDSGEYVSYISSDNKHGSYLLGKLLVKAMKAKGGQDGEVGIIAIPQKRLNGQARTSGFMKALDEGGIKSAGIRQQVNFSYQETYDHSIDLIQSNPRLKALWLQGSDRYKGALDAIRDSGMEGKVLLICFDAEPEFIEMISKGELVGAGMQQPYLMGEEAARLMDEHLNGKDVPKEILLPVLAVSRENIQSLLPKIRRNVLGLPAR